MIYEVRLPHETKFYLWQITCLQIDVLTCAVQLQSGFTERNLQTALRRKMHQQRAALVTNWICNHRDTREGLQTFVTGTQCERQHLVMSMQRDVLRLYCARRNETLECCFANNLPEYQKGAKQFLLAFYGQLSNGIPTDILASNPRNYHRYGREQFFKAYEKANPRQSVCAICDEHRPITIIRGHVHSNIEHYFPKSVYPHLACHPYNLIPICDACNSAHLDRDPLNSGNHTRRTLLEVFLPYRNETVLTHGTVKFEWVQANESPALSIITRDTNVSNLFHARMQAFSEIYDIPQRWQRQIHRIGEQLWRQMIAFSRAEFNRDRSLDIFNVKSGLEQLLHYLFEDLKSNSWNYVLIWYLSHLLITEIEANFKNQQKESALVQTLADCVKLSHRSHDKSPHVSLTPDRVIEISRDLYNT